MTNKKLIILADEPINKNKILESIINLQILPKINTKIPICVKLGNYNLNKIIYKSKEYIVKNNEIFHKINDIMKNLVNDIYFDEIIIEINSNKNIEYYDLPCYKSDYIDDKLLSLYNKYLQLDNIIIINYITNCISSEFIDIIYNYDKDMILLYKVPSNNEIENIDLTKYIKYYYIYDDNNTENQSSELMIGKKSKDYIPIEFINYLNSLNDNKNTKNILNKLYLDLDNYEELSKVTYDTFFNHIYTLNNYRHRHFYKPNNYNISSNNYDEIKKEFNNNNFELLDEYKNNKDIINKSIDIFDKVFDNYIKKLEPELLKYYLVMYYNSNDYNDEFEKNKEYEFLLMIKGLRKMCISIVKKEMFINDNKH